MARKVLTVFISSTGKDLEDYRAEIRKHLGAFEFFKCIVMEEFGPKDSDAVRYCREKAQEADLFVGIIGHRRGWEPEGDSAKRSITEMEYDAATELGRPRFICLAPEDFPIASSLRDSDDQHARQKAFRERVGKTRVAGVYNFDTPAALAGEIGRALCSHIIAGDLIKDLRPDLKGAEAAEARAPIAAAIEASTSLTGEDVGAAVQDPDQLDVKELESRLRAGAELHEKRGTDEHKQSAELYRHIGALAYLHDTQTALDAYRKATVLDPNRAEGWNLLGLLLMRVGELDQAAGAFERVLEFGNQSADKSLVATASGNLGIFYRRRGDLDRAEAMHRLALELEMGLGGKEGMANQYGNLGNIHFLRGDLDEAEAMHCKSLELHQELGHLQGIAKAHGNLGIVLNVRGDLDQAEAMHRKALNLHQKLGDKEGMANEYGNLGNVLIRRGDLDQGEGMHRHALKHDTELGDLEGMAEDFANLGTVLKKSGDAAAACIHWRKARELYRALGSPNAATVETWMREAGCDVD